MLTRKWSCCCCLLPCSITAWRISGEHKAALVLVLPEYKILFLCNIYIKKKRKIFQNHNKDSYLAGDIRGHGWRRLRMGVGILWDEARVVGGDAAEPMSSRWGHLKQTVGTMLQSVNNRQSHNQYCHVFYSFHFFLWNMLFFRRGFVQKQDRLN